MRVMVVPVATRRHPDDGPAAAVSVYHRHHGPRAGSRRSWPFGVPAGRELREDRRRPGQSRSPVRRHSPQRRLDGRGASGRPCRVGRRPRAGRGAGRVGPLPRPRPGAGQAPHVHERVRPRRAQGPGAGARPARRAAGRLRRLRPALRPPPPACGRQRRRPQRAALDHRRAGQSGVRPPAGGHRRAGVGRHRPRAQPVPGGRAGGPPGGHRRGRRCGRGVGPRRGRARRQPVERMAPPRGLDGRDGADGAVGPPPPESPCRRRPPTGSAARRPAGAGILPRDRGATPRESDA